MIKCWSSNQAIGTDAGNLQLGADESRARNLDGHSHGGGQGFDPLVPRRGQSRLPFQRPGLPSPARRRQNLPQRRRNTYFMFELHNAIKPYNGNDGCPPGRRDLTEVRCPPTESESHLPGRFTSFAREPLAPHGPR